MTKNNWLNLQLFAGEGTGDGGGEGASSGESAVDAGQQRLLELGVPAEKIRKRQKSAVKLPDGAVRTAPTTPKAQEAQGEQQTNEQVAAADNPTEEKSETKSRMTWDEIMADPEYNKNMQATIKGRLKEAHEAADQLKKLAPALELLARQHNLDVNNIDYDALTQAISDDNAFYEDKALEMGVPIETAKKIDQEERQTARQQREQERTLEEQKIQNHLAGLEAQGEALKKIFPNFDLRTELQNPAFFRMTSPNVGISVEDAYFAVHRNEIQAATSQVTAQKTMQKISNSIQAGSYRPDEAGITGQASSVTTFDYSKASKDQREALKKAIRDAAARGEKLYPGR
jgi:hypothetical protein